VQRLLAETSVADGNWGLGIQTRARALVSDGEEAERSYREAIERLGRTHLRPELARAPCSRESGCAGKVAASTRERSRTAYEQFHDDRDGRVLRARPNRTHRDWRKGGETERRDPRRLTVQERRIAQLARDGLSNPEIWARLFLSPCTVEWHLRKVFEQLGVRSRRELRDALAHSGPGPA
jgi:DNA-binding CsgD family transcriptional regulator